MQDEENPSGGADPAVADAGGDVALWRRLLFGCRKGPAEYRKTSWLFLRLLGFAYLFAFGSLWVQLDGLSGSRGIYPAQGYLNAVQRNWMRQEQRLAAASGDPVPVILPSEGAIFRWKDYRRLPTLLWVDSSDRALHFICGGGIVLSILLIFGVTPVPVLIMLWLFYLSLLKGTYPFLNFQWDILLVEVGFLAIFIAPWQVFPDPDREKPPSLIVIWLYRILLFRLMLSSGIVKILSQDPTWLDQTAMTFHFETQPIPNAIAWFVHQQPLWASKLSCSTMFIVELYVPFLIFAPRRLRIAGGLVIIILQLVIILTGNYCFFNFLTIALGVLLLDDAALCPFLPDKLTATRQWVRRVQQFDRELRAAIVARVRVRVPELRPALVQRLAFCRKLVPRVVTVVLAIVIVDLGVTNMTRTVTRRSPLPKRYTTEELMLMPDAKVIYRDVPILMRPAIAALRVVHPEKEEEQKSQKNPKDDPDAKEKSPGYISMRRDQFHDITRPFALVNSYGLFAMMTKSRPEIVIEGSNDGVIWMAYEFRWKAGKLDRPPPWVAPHQPRLDWQMWFEALRPQRGQKPTAWFNNFLARLLYGAPEVLELMHHNPFPDKPPKYIRAQLYNYQFTDWSTRRDDGTWWKRDYLGMYVRPRFLRR